jgi:hypothetical protein
LGNIRANGHPNGGPWRQLYCRGCQGYFQETHGLHVTWGESHARVVRRAKTSQPSDPTQPRIVFPGAGL